MNWDNQEALFEASQNRPAIDNYDELLDWELAERPEDSEGDYGALQPLTDAAAVESGKDALPPTEALFEWYGILPPGDADNSVYPSRG